MGAVSTLHGEKRRCRKIAKHLRAMVRLGDMVTRGVNKTHAPGNVPNDAVAMANQIATVLSEILDYRRTL